MDSLEIQVTQEHIDSAGDGGCPIELALQQYYPDALVSMFTYILTSDNKTYSLIQEQMDFVADFDNNNGVEPFVFTILPHVLQMEGLPK